MKDISNRHSSHKPSKLRVLALFCILSIISVISLVAIELGAGPGDSPPDYMGYGEIQAYAPPALVHVNVDYNGNIHVQPYGFRHYIDVVDDSHRIVRFPAHLHWWDVSASVPYGWAYRVDERQDTHYPYSPVVSVSLYAPPVYYHGGDLSYSPYQAYGPGGDISEAPMPMGDEISPFGGGLMITINGNGIAMGDGQTHRFTQANGTMGAYFYTILIPIRPGHAFMWIDTQPDGRGIRVTSSTVFNAATTVYLVWGFNVAFQGNGLTLPNPAPQAQTNPHNAFVNRVIPDGWTIAEAIASPKLFTPPDTGLPIAFPHDPVRVGFVFVAWYDIAIAHTDETIPHPTGTRLNVNTTITQPTTFFARWRTPLNHLVRFDMNDAANPGAFLQPGTPEQPQRLYRFALHHRSIADSSLGGAAATGLGAPAGTALDGDPWVGLTPIPPEERRQNIQRPFVPNQPFGLPGHMDRSHPNYTPYTPGSGLINPPGASLAANAGTAWPRSAPDVRHSNMWIPTPGAPGAPGAPQQRYTLEGWWTQPFGWRQNTTTNIVSHRFVPPGLYNTYISAEPGTWGWTAVHNPIGFPVGLARRASAGWPDDSQDPHNPLPGLVTGDMTVYANWVYRVTFDLNGGTGDAAGNWGNQGFLLSWFQWSVPSGNNNVNFRDILPEAPVRTINAAGTRVTETSSGSSPTHRLHQPVSAGMPPNPTRTHHQFNGWWDRPVAAIPQGTPNAATYPATNHGAVAFTGDTQIDGSQRVWAHWIHIPPTPTPTPAPITFNLNATPACAATEGDYARAYWPTYRPANYDHNNPTGRFFLSRTAIPGLGISGPMLREFNDRYTTSDLAFANVSYADRYSLTITRMFAMNAAIQDMSANQAYMRMPRNPRKTGYVFVGWHPDPDFEPLLANGTPAPGVWNPSTVLTMANHPGTLYAVWAPSFDLILVGNGNTGNPGPNVTATEFVRNMALGFTPNEMAGAGRWPGPTIHWMMQSGLDYFSNTFSIAGTPTLETSGAGRLHAHGWRTLFLHSSRTQIGPTNAFNVQQNPTPANSYIIQGTTRFSQDFIDSHGGFGTRPDGSRYFRIYLQWGATVTFNTNHATPGIGGTNAIRQATVGVGYSINDSLLRATRHLHQLHRVDVFPSFGATAVTGQWMGTNGTATVEGTRGGWPRNPTTPTDVSGGDWAHLFAQPTGLGFALVGWNDCPNGQGTWFFADTPIYDNVTIYAIWRPWITLRPGIPESSPFFGEINMDPARYPANDPSGVLHRYVTLGQPFPTPFPGDPIWPGRSFEGWFPEPSPDDATMAGLQALGPGNVVVVRPYYAVWRTGVTFNPNPPGNPTAGARIGNLSVNQTTGVQHVIGRFITPPIPHPGYSLVSRPGGWIPTNNWFALEPDPNNPGEFIRRIYTPGGPRTIMQAMEVHKEWLGTVTFRPGHPRGRLDGLATNANITRQVPEGLTIGQNPAGQQVPTAAAALAAAPWINDPGLNFGGWRRFGPPPLNIPLNADGTPVTAGAAHPILSPEDVAAIPVNHYELFFEAVWGLRMEFYKVGDRSIPTGDPLGYAPRAGARFVLERETSPGVWTQAYPIVTTPPIFLESGPDGGVFIGSAFTPLLELNNNAATSFRLRETRGPAGYRTPSGHWDVTIGQQLGIVPAFVPQGGNPGFSTVIVASGALEGQRQLVGNVPYTFDFWKVNSTHVRLQNAQMRLLVFNGTSTPPEVLITSDMIGSGPSQWTCLGTRTSSLTLPMTWRMDINRYYQMLETVPPIGYQMPMGQWRIVVNPVNPPTYPDRTFTVTRIGGAPMPNIIPDPNTANAETYFIINWLNHTLPLTGGSGSMPLLMAGGGVVFAAMIGGAVVMLRKRKENLRYAHRHL